MPMCYGAGTLKKEWQVNMMVFFENVIIYFLSMFLFIIRPEKLIEVVRGYEKMKSLTGELETQIKRYNDLLHDNETGKQNNKTNDNHYS